MELEFLKEKKNCQDEQWKKDNILIIWKSGLYFQDLWHGHREAPRVFLVSQSIWISELQIPWEAESQDNGWERHTVLNYGIRTLAHTHIHVHLYTQIHKSKCVQTQTCTKRETEYHNRAKNDLWIRWPS